MENNDNNPGKRLKSIRNELRYTQRQFAEILSMDSSYLSAVEGGKDPLSKKLSVLLEAKFRISSNYLLTGEGNKFLGLNPLFPHTTEVLDSWDSGMTKLQTNPSYLREVEIMEDFVNLPGIPDFDITQLKHIIKLPFEGNEYSNDNELIKKVGLNQFICDSILKLEGDLKFIQVRLMFVRELTESILKIKADYEQIELESQTVNNLKTLWDKKKSFLKTSSIEDKIIYLYWLEQLNLRWLERFNNLFKALFMVVSHPHTTKRNTIEDQYKAELSSLQNK